MRNDRWALVALAAAGVYGAVGTTGASSQAAAAERDVIIKAATALGGRDRILSIKTLRIDGYGQLAYQNGGGNIAASIDAPQKWVNINGFQRTIDLEHGRMRIRQRLVQDFVFAYARNMTGAIRNNQVLDGDIAFNVGADGRATRAGDAAVRSRRIEMLAHPVAIVRAALDPATKVSNLRRTGAQHLVDLTTASGDTLTLAVDAATQLPAWVSWVGPDPNLGDVRFRTSFVGYQAERGVLLPSGFNTTMDFRGVVQQKLYVDRSTIDGPIDDMAAPPEVRAAPAPAPQPPAITVTPVAKGIWYLKGQGNSTLFEFADHLTLFEAYGSEANANAIIEKARSIVPGKPVTEVIVSHHHFDHTGGLRAAVAAGLTIITQRGNVAFFQEITARPAKIFPDALGRGPKPIQIKAVDDRLSLKDGSMEVVVYRVMSNSHMANGVLAYVPRDRLVAEGDLVDEGWDIVWWGNSYPDTVKHWKLDVETDLPVHGNMHSYKDVLQLLQKQTRNAQDLCASVEKAGLSMQGCPVANTF
jgi:glyoxylase-like metal-dependent hydrolase (beta-lactamase superfamily II)